MNDLVRGFTIRRTSATGLGTMGGLMAMPTPAGRDGVSDFRG
jgi:hypothetical protein